MNRKTTDKSTENIPMPTIIKTVLKAALGVIFGFISILIISLYFFSKPVFEYGLHVAGFPEARSESVSFGLDGTTIRKLTLAKGISIDELKLYATPSDLLHARLGQLVISGAKADLAELDDKKDSGTINLPVNIHVGRIEISQSAILLPTPSGVLNISTTGSIIDRGDTYQGNLMFDSQESFGKASGQVTATLQKESGDIKVHLDLADAKLVSPHLDIKRTSGWVEGTFNLRNMSQQTVINAQITTGAVRVYDIPLQGTTLTASTAEGKTQILLQAQAQSESGTVLLDLQTADDKLTLGLDASLQNLESLAIAGLKGQGAINLSLAAEKKPSASWGDLNNLLKINGDISVSAKKLSIPDLMSGMNVAARSAISLAPETRHITLDISEIDFDSPQISFNGKPSRLKILATDTPTLLGNLELQKITAGGKNTPQWTTPLDLSLQFSSPKNSTSVTIISGEIKEKNGLLYLKLEGEHDAKLQKGALKIDMPPLKFIRGVTDLGDIFPFLEAYISESSGVTGLVAQTGWARKESGWETTASATLLLKQFSGIFFGYPVDGINTVLHLDSLSPPIFSRQSVFIGALNAGIPLTNGVLQLSLDPARNLALHQGQWTLAKGTLSATPFTVNLDQKNADITLTATGLDLPELFKIAPLEGLDATGQVSGQLPIRLRDSRISLVGGVLETQGPGAIRYNPSEVPEFLQDSSQKQIVDLRVALKAFDFETLRMTLDGEIGEKQKISLHAKGKNPEFYGGYPVNINLTVEGPLQSVLKYTPGGNQIPDSIKQQIESFEKQHASQ